MPLTCVDPFSNYIIELAYWWLMRSQGISPPKQARGWLFHLLGPANSFLLHGFVQYFFVERSIIQ